MAHFIRIFTMCVIAAFVLNLYAGAENALSQNDVSLGFIGIETSVDEVNPDAAAAYEYAELFFEDPVYISIDEIADDGLSALEGFDVVWWHFSGDDGSPDLPAISTSETALVAFEDYVSGGGGLFLSGLGGQLVTAMGLTEEEPIWIQHNEGIETGDWGFYILEEDHPIFEGLTNPFYTVSQGLIITESLAWFDEPQLGDGVRLAMIEIGGDHPGSTTAEWSLGNGAIINVTTGAYVFDWEGSNAYEDNLYEYTTNVINYLSTVATSSEPGAEVPEIITLRQNYPNPFNPSTVISFDLNQSTTVTLEVYDVMGRFTQVLVDNHLYGVGTHEVNFDASGLASGVYLYKLQAGSVTQTRLMQLIK